MLTIFEEDGDLKIRVENGYPIENFTTTFSCTISSESHRKLLLHNLNEKLQKRIEGIREGEYKAGYKDGRAKREKRKWFSVQLKPGASE